jgi:site-specific recombinase XerD
MLMGYLYQPKLKSGGRSSLWWVKYYANGRPIRESTGTEKETEARRFLKAREGRVATGQPILPRVDRIRYGEVAEDLRRHYETSGDRDLREARARFEHLARFFTGRRVAAIGPADITAYVETRQGEQAANGTINRELATLSRMLRLAYENGKLLRLPVIRKLKEAPPRQGFFERDRYEAVRRHLRPDLQVAAAIEYALGWRCQSEALTLELRQLDLKAGTIRLDPGDTKNDDGRLVYLPPDLHAQIAAQLERVRALERQTGRIIPYLFPHLRGARRRGERIRDFRKAWGTACRQAGCPGMLRHDFRRTAVRNMVNDGTPEKVAMMITGHRTRAVFDRYHIVAPEDLKAAAARMAARDGHVLGHVRAAAR